MKRAGGGSGFRLRGLTSEPDVRRGRPGHRLAMAFANSAANQGRSTFVFKFYRRTYGVACIPLCIQAHPPCRATSPTRGVGVLHCPARTFQPRAASEVLQTDRSPVCRGSLVFGISDMFEKRATSDKFDIASLLHSHLNLAQHEENSAGEVWKMQTLTISQNRCCTKPLSR